MELTTIASTTAQRSVFVAPTFGPARGGLRPQDSSSRVGIDVLGIGGMAAGCRSWSPPIT